MSNTLNFLSSYCERAGNPALLAEPINAITNLFFLYFAFVAFKDFQKSHKSSWKKADIIWLIINLGLIGIGSGLWHIYANQYTNLADVFPILIFINVYIISFYKRVIGFNWLKTISLWLGFQALNILSEIYLPRDMLGGSIMYIPTYIILILNVIILYWQRNPAFKQMLKITLIWSISLFSRSIDLSACQLIPFGTHFIWHAINAWVLFSLINIVIPRRNKHL